MFGCDYDLSEGICSGEVRREGEHLSRQAGRTASALIRRLSGAPQLGLVLKNTLKNRLLSLLNAWKASVLAVRLEAREARLLEGDPTAREELRRMQEWMEAEALAKPQGTKVAARAQGKGGWRAEDSCIKTGRSHARWPGNW